MLECAHFPGSLLVGGRWASDSSLQADAGPVDLRDEDKGTAQPCGGDSDRRAHVSGAFQSTHGGLQSRGGRLLPSGLPEMEHPLLAGRLRIQRYVAHDQRSSGSGYPTRAYSCEEEAAPKDAAEWPHIVRIGRSWPPHKFGCRAGVSYRGLTPTHRPALPAESPADGGQGARWADRRA